MRRSCGISPQLRRRNAGEVRRGRGARRGRGWGPRPRGCRACRGRGRRRRCRGSRRGRSRAIGSSTPTRSSAVWKIVGSGLRTPSSHESMMASNSSSSGNCPRHASPYSRMLLVTIAVRRPFARTMRTASTTSPRSISSVTIIENISPVSKRNPCASAAALICVQRVDERDLTPLELVPRVVGVGVVGAEHDLHHARGVDVLRARVRVRGGERRRGEDAAVVPEDGVEVAHRPCCAATRGVRGLDLGAEVVGGVAHLVHHVRRDLPALDRRAGRRPARRSSRGCRRRARPGTRRGTPGRRGRRRPRTSRR